MILGVCKGLALHFDISVGWTRFLTLLAFLFTGLWPVGLAYLALGLLLKPEPVMSPLNEDGEEFYRSYTDSRKMALSRLKRTYENLDRRIQRMEDLVTSREFDWEGRLSR
jgi:phage shock protein C